MGQRPFFPRHMRFSFVVDKYVDPENNKEKDFFKKELCKVSPKLHIMQETAVGMKLRSAKHN